MQDELFGMLLQELPSFDRGLRAAHARGDVETLVQTVHKLNGAAIYCGVPALKHAAERLESDIKGGRLGRVDGLLAALLDEIDRVQKYAKERPALTDPFDRR